MITLRIAFRHTRSQILRFPRREITHAISDRLDSRRINPRSFPVASASAYTCFFSTRRRISEQADRPPIPSLPTAVSTLKSLYHATNKIKTRIVASSYGRLMRLDKPIGTHLLFLPCAWSITLAATPVDTIKLIPLFYTGAMLLRGAGCTVNDIWDADIDRRVLRTKDRPIASGEITTTTAMVFLGAQLSAGLVILSQLNTASFLVGSLSVIPVMFYPLAKRRLDHPQAVLGVTFNWGALLGYTAATGTLALPAFLLHGAGFCWTMVYDTIYAHQDKFDDRRVGIKSTALSFGANTKAILAVFTAGKLAFLTAMGFMSDLSMPFYVGIAFSTMHLGRQVYATDLSNPSQCHAAFVSNSKTGAITWAAILLGRIF